MAIEFECANLLKLSSKQGVKFDSTLMIGRQSILLSNKEIDILFKSYKNYSEIYNKQYAEDFFRFLGAKKIDSIDFSKYEGATIIGDLNKKLSINPKFDLIFDGGSLEHIFNIPVAIENYTNLLKVGGRFIGFLPVNNQLGHGFYQFSPEFFFRAFSEENGFEVEKAIIIEYGPKIKLFNCIDPLKARYSSHVMNKYPLYIYFQAKKVGGVKRINYSPSQYIYSGSLWSKKSIQKNSFKLFSKIRSELLGIFPKYVRRLNNLLASKNRRYSLRNDKLFKKIN